MTERDRLMQQPQLRIYFGPQQESPSTTQCNEASESVTIPLGEIFEWLNDAMRSGRTWLQDFKDDEVTISSDLYEVILAYRHYRRPSA
jgi:hypothetical protein